ncbi:uracil phosphoribosyltransferase [Cellulomonas sp. PhB143]|uniref:uracil phosphoribosyltransferase n=1 Tax=Cellulomonas sp. PhB143 TaxID=2485186 RepID=UPI000F4A27F4|nr:uracil phosphoribosyltransferase [Cellulomonas sp. PhB143]ROS72072.1 uracil phosphoribosyltransferase [Cellulomonas sp. PhB143]
MRVHAVDHPLVAHKLTILRDERTPSPTFRLLVDELVTLLAYEATREVRTEPREITTPIGPTTGQKIAEPRPLVVPILRAGLGMLDGLTRLLPTAEVGFLGMQRDETTLEAVTYANRLPEDLSGRHCFLVDPMLATGGTLVAAIDYLFERGARHVTCVCILAAPEGIEVVNQAVGERVDVELVVAAIDERLDENAYIVPGLGDAGDRLYGVV